MAGKDSRSRSKGHGLEETGRRFAWENMVLRRLFPNLAAKLDYFINGLVKGPRYRRIVAQFANSPTPPWFSHVELETLNRCNGGCEFCPVNRNAVQRPLARMSESLFEDILRQLAAIRYNKGLSLYSNNEPLLATRMPDFAALAKKRPPRAYLKLYTNGTLLTLDLFRQIVPHLDKLTVNNYNPIPEMHENIKEIRDTN